MPKLLKRLELNGFKSFAQKTVLEFPGGITAIVGPNGSGKSNVIDAIRWLLGEREAKNLRGAKVEDLIFAGTPKKPRVGQAHAALHFENAGNFFPLEFSEIVVSRQANRDGSNKYFLNKSEIRLKDLIDFFAKARLGTKGLVVISQGNSDIFVEASPVGRREMVEEMLGLREYQLKKTGAEQRLKATQVNLDKVDALMKELLPHLRSLKRQTGRWEKRESMEQELRELENQLFGWQWRAFEEQISEIGNRIDTHKDELKRLQKEKETAEEHLKSVESSQPREREALARLKKESNALFEKRSGLQKELGRLEAKLELEREVPARASVPAHALVDSITKIKVRFERAVEGDLDTLRGAVRETLRDIEALFSPEAGKGTETQGKISPELDVRFAELKKALQDIDGEISKFRKQEEELSASQESFYQSFKKAIANVEAAKERIEKWESGNQERLFEKERLELRLSELKRQMLQAGRAPEEFSAAAVGDKGDARAEVLSGEASSSLERRIFKLRGDLASMGEVDEALVKEAKETETRYAFLEQQSADLEKAKNDLRGLIVELSEKIRNEFKEAIGKINTEFGSFFRTMFDGGQAKLRIVKYELKTRNGGEAENDEEQKKSEDENEEEKFEEGIEVEIHLPRKRINSLETLSGGERSLVGIAALFAMISVSPPPFLVLDEVDAALDNRNSRRFAEMLKAFSQKTQFIVVTHNRAVMEAADILYGVTLNEDGTSKILSLKLED